jgi:hypothetical protein
LLHAQVANKSASWTVGNAWPQDGEVDMLEGWNTNAYNKPAFHMADSGTYGSCKIENVGQSASVATANCDNTFQNPPTQWLNQGCVGNDVNGPWANSDGGVCKLLSTLSRLGFD